MTQIVEEKKIKLSDPLNKSYDVELESFKSLTGDSDADSLKAFIHQITSGVTERLSPIVLRPSSDKSHRTVSFESDAVGSYTLIGVLFLLIYYFFVWFDIVDNSLFISFRQSISFSRSILNSLLLTQ